MSSRHAAHQAGRVVLAAAALWVALTVAAPLLLRALLAWALAWMAACRAVPCRAVPCRVLVAWLGARCLGPGAGPSCLHLMGAWALLRRVLEGHLGGLVVASGGPLMGSLAWLRKAGRMM
jgi:hypothetical protein